MILNQHIVTTNQRGGIVISSCHQRFSIVNNTISKPRMQIKGFTKRFIINAKYGIGGKQ